jgi:hypothetical protein
MTKDARRLVGQPVSRINNLGFQANLFLDMMAVMHFDNFPSFLRHVSTSKALLESKYTAKSNRSKSVRHHV